MRRRSFLQKIVATSLMGGCLLTGCEEEEGLDSRSIISVGDNCPNFSVTDMAGVTHTFPVMGKPSLLFFFDINCSDCLQQFPAINDLYQLYGDKVGFLAIARGNNAEEVAQFLEKRQYAFPVAIDETAAIYGKFAESGVPRVYILRNSRVMYMSDDKTLLHVSVGTGQLESLLGFFQ